MENITLICLTNLITLVQLTWKWMGLFSKKSHLKILGESFSSKLNWSSDMVSTVKTALKKLEPQFFLKFLSSDVYFNSVKPLYTYIKPTCIEYCHCVWAGCSSCYLNIWDKLQKWICRTTDPLHADWNISSLLKCSQVESFL